MRRCVLAVAVAMAGLLLAVSPAAADGGEGGYHNNLVILNNSNPARQAVRSSTVTARDIGDGAVTDTNLAYARSHDCTGCRTVAVAVQVVIVQGNPSNIQPQNGAVALNENCQSCHTFAYAHQYLITVAHSVEWDEGTSERLQEIQWSIDHVAKSGVDFPTMSGQLDQLSQQYYATVQQALQNQGGAQGHEDQRQVQEHD